MKELTISLLRKSIQKFHEEQIIPWKFIDFVNNCGKGRMTDRTNPVGHLTASAIISDRCGERFLLLYHKGLGKWLQPGGHIEPEDESLMAAAMREVEEETGLTGADYDVMMTAAGAYVIDVDSHLIPANPAKGEPEHFHHDVRFLLRVKEDVLPVRIDPCESGGFRWFLPGEFPEYFRPVNVFAGMKDFTQVMENFGDCI